MTYPIHPAAELFPMMSVEELSELASDIRENGQLEPIVIFDGQVLDGRNRIKACELVGIEPISHTVTNIASPVVYVLSRNLHRRHLSISQRAAIAVETLPMLQEEAKQRKESTRGEDGRFNPLLQSCDDGGRANDIAAAATQVSPRIVARAASVKRDDPAAFEAVKRGDITVNAAAKEQEKRRGSTHPVGGHQPKGTDTKVGQIKAEANKKRMGDGLAMIGGVCHGLEHMNVELALAACTDDEIDGWATKAETHARELKKFAAKLRGAISNGKSSPSTQPEDASGSTLDSPASTARTQQRSYQKAV